ncbi:MAG TPA: GNAT family N-acetyltransferase [Verrucomicrobiae bacterium]|nr:GNAT family N-acetyltransferase [Verrucomicrobiae bacterium]
MKPYEQTDGDLVVSDDRSRLDIPLIHAFLSERSYWAKGVPVDVVQRSIRYSLCLGMYHAGRQIGFARVVTDFTTFAWLADVFIIEEFRDRGHGRKLVAAVMGHPELQGLRRFMLGTRDAHKFYERYGFAPLGFPERFMEIQQSTGYKCC